MCSLLGSFGSNYSVQFGVRVPIVEIAVMGRQAVSAFWLSTIGLPADVVIMGGSVIEGAVRVAGLTLGRTGSGVSCCPSGPRPCMPPSGPGGGAPRRSGV